MFSAERSDCLRVGESLPDTWNIPSVCRLFECQRLLAKGLRSFLLWHSSKRTLSSAKAWERHLVTPRDAIGRIKPIFAVVPTLAVGMFRPSGITLIPANPAGTSPIGLRTDRHRPTIVRYPSASTLRSLPATEVSALRKKNSSGNPRKSEKSRKADLSIFHLEKLLTLPAHHAIRVRTLLI